MANLLVRHVESNLRPFRNPPSESYSPRIVITGNLTGNCTKIGPFGETLPVITQQNQLVADNSLQNETANLLSRAGNLLRLAKKQAAKLAHRMGEVDLETKLRGEAQILRKNFEAAFWCQDLGTFALALDGNKNPCRVRTSNAGHALFTGIASPGLAARVAGTLLGPDSFSGWGIRTVASGAARFNPISYHNGSIWPHDNAMIALGFARYGFKSHAARVFSAMFEAAAYQDLRRLPELFCGFIRKPHRGPTAYPVACAPQAWASAAPFAFLGACLGMELRHEVNAVSFRDPAMPSFLDHVILNQLSLGNSRIDLKLQRHGSDITLNLLRRRGDAKVMLVK
jgi:glycogen debranching enzyme